MPPDLPDPLGPPAGSPFGPTREPLGPPDRGHRSRRPRAAAALLLLPVTGLLAVPAYDRVEPRLAGVPFFYWYQLSWLVLAVACMGAAALLLPPRAADLGGTR